jgi:hypothetical protein
VSDIYINQRTVDDNYELIIKHPNFDGDLHVYFHRLDSTIRASAMLPPGWPATLIVLHPERPVEEWT